MKKKIFSSLLDEMIVFGFSVLGLLLFELILRICGFTMVTTSIFLLIIFFLFNVLYYPVIEGGKYGTTIGKRILKLDEERETAVVEEVKEEASMEEAKESKEEDTKE